MLDYKTDRIEETVDDHVREKLKEKYNIQLELYARALENIWHEPIYRKYLYFFDKELIIEI